MADHPPLPVLIDAAYALVNRRIAEGLVERGFTDIRAAHGKVFENLGEGRTLTELAERAQISKQSMAELVQHLEAGGYVVRVAHPVDRRARIVRLTRRGEQAVTAAWEVLSALIDAWRAELGDRTYEATVRGMAAIVARTGDR